MEAQETRGSGGRNTLSTDDLFEVLKNDRRREAVRFLARTDGPTTLPDLATHVADGSGSTPSGSYRSAYVSLQQSHLPVLIDCGVVEYDPESKRIDRGPQFEPVVEYLSASTSSTPNAARSSLVDVAVASTGLALLLGDRAELVSFDEGAALAVSALSLLALCALNLARLLRPELL